MNDYINVSVLVPIYGVEKYIERCARSLFEQTMKEGIEFIFTDDCTPDNSVAVLIEVLNDYPERKSQVKIIRHEENKGLAVARVTGLKAAKGEYVIHCDSDDWPEFDMYEVMYHHAKTNDSDIVICDFYEGDDNSEEYRRQNVPEEPLDIFKAIINESLHSAMWNKMVRKKYLEKINVNVNPEISMWEDMAYMTPVLISGGKISKIDKALYHYRCIPLSMSRTLSVKTINSRIKVAEYISEYIHSLPYSNDFGTWLDLLKLKSKDCYLILGETYNQQLWRQTFPESHKSIFSRPIPIIKKVLYSLCDQHLDFLARILVGLRKKV